MNKYALFGLELHGQKINGKDAHAVMPEMARSSLAMLYFSSRL